ncbi:MAG TPA: hypothetical protein VIE65_04145 [Methylobacter sp.]|jgi:hypothetical protein
MARTKSISLTLRGFELTPEEVERLVGVKATSLLHKGAPVKPGVKTLAVRHAAKFELGFPAETALFEMVPAIMAHLGGVEHLIGVREKVAPEFIEVDLLLHVRNSEEQEGGFIDTESLAALSRLRATLSLSFP